MSIPSDPKRPAANINTVNAAISHPSYFMWVIKTSAPHNKIEMVKKINAIILQPSFLYAYSADPVHFRAFGFLSNRVIPFFISSMEHVASSMW